jgi:hypothetical protein
MGRTRRILSNFSVLNIVLAAVLVVFAYNMILPLFGKGAKLTVPSPKKQAVVTEKTAEKPADTKSPSPSDYFVIAEQNIFHPERKIPVEKKDIAAPLPKPEFVLYGTLLLDNLRIAYMEDRKAPQSSPTRGKKQIPVRLGEALSGFILKEIDADKVVMVRGDEKLDVYLDDPSKSKTREGSVVGQQPPGQPQQGQPPSVAARPGAAPASPVQRVNPPPASPAAQGRGSLFRRMNRPLPPN